jgi:hypothetical protein
MDEWLWSNGGMILTGVNWSTWRKIHPIATLFKSDPTQAGLGLNRSLDVRDSCQCYSTVLHTCLSYSCTIGAVWSDSSTLSFLPPPTPHSTWRPCLRATLYRVSRRYFVTLKWKNMVPPKRRCQLIFLHSENRKDCPVINTCSNCTFICNWTERGTNWGVTRPGAGMLETRDSVKRRAQNCLLRPNFRNSVWSHSA